MKASISFRTGTLYIVLFAALLAGTAAFAAGDPAPSAGPRNTIVPPEPRTAPKAQLAALNVDPADLGSRKVSCRSFRAGPRDTIPACR